MFHARFHLTSVGLWTTIFVGMSAAGGVGDTHSGQWLAFWQGACTENRPNGCRHLGVLVSTYCDRGSRWACNEYGILVQPAIRPALAAEAFECARGLSFAPGCDNVQSGRTDRPVRAAPELADDTIVLRPPKGTCPAPAPLQTYRLACEQGCADEWRRACEQARSGTGPEDLGRQ